MRILLIGASGGVGRAVLAEAARRDWAVIAQTRDPAKLDPLPCRGQILGCDPRDAEALADGLAGADAAVFALGVDTLGKTTLFSASTAALIAAMGRAGVRRLVAVTGVGAGETRGHGGFLYDRIIFPLFTRRRYEDKERQEAMIAESGLDWTIVRPAPFSERPQTGPVEVHETVAPGLVLRRIRRAEVAAFLCDCVETGAHIGARPFIGRP
jgi:putative NADH-flavin reductase